MKRKLLFVVLALVLLATAWVTLKTIRAVRLARELNQVARSLEQQTSAFQHPEDLDTSLEVARADLARAETLVADLRTTLWPFLDLLKALGWVPVYGDDLVAIPHILDVLASLFEIAHTLDSTFSPLLTDTGQDQLATLSQILQDEHEALDWVRGEMEAVYSARAQIPLAEALHPRLRDALHSVDRLIELVDRGLLSLDALVPLLGVEEPHHILVLLQSADEIRPTGGFITSSAYIVIDQGQIIEMTVLASESSEIDRVGEILYEPPPAPMEQYMALPLWLFRDANWSPDFPTSAARAAELYTLGREVPVDTVVAVNEYAIRDFVAAVGEITLDDGTVIRADNFLDLFQDLYAEYFEERGLEGRKDFIPELAPQMLDRFLSADTTEEILSYWRTARDVAARNDLLVYSANPEIQALAEQLGWDGSISDHQGDYLYVVDADVGYSKVGSNIERSLTYHVSLADLATPYSVLELEYQNLSSGDPTVCFTPERHPYQRYVNQCFADYLRLYLPDGSEMYQAPWFQLPEAYERVRDADAGRVRSLFDERDKEVYGGLMVVARGSSSSATFAYALPPRILSLRHDNTILYDLLIQKQPGVPPYSVSVTIDLPSGAQPISITPEPAYQDAITVFFDRMSLDTNLRIQVVMHVP